MNFDRILSTITGAAVLGLFILNWQGTNELIKTASQAATGYVAAIQGRG